MSFLNALGHIDAQVYTTVNDSSSHTPIGYVAGGVVALFMIICLWKVFKKAGQPGWAAIIPIYGSIVLLRTVKRPWWWIILLLIPVVDIVVHYIVSNNLSKAFGKGGGTTFLLFWLPFIGYPVLAFGEATYKPAALKR